MAAPTNSQPSGRSPHSTKPKAADKLSPEQLALGGAEAMIEAGMDELSLVVRGAVPGSQVRRAGARRG